MRLALFQPGREQAGQRGEAAARDGRQERAFIGDDEDWDVIVTASYPDRRSFVRLFLDPDYRDAFRHRRAAVDRYRAVIGAAPG